LHASFGKAAKEGADHNLPIQAPGSSFCSEWW
jgi:hypothetical protein